MNHEDVDNDVDDEADVYNDVNVDSKDDADGVMKGMAALMQRWRG